MSETPDLEAAELMRTIAAGDDRALGVAFDRHGGLVHALAVRMLGDAAEAQDVLQEVFVSLWRSAARLDPTRGSLAGWLLATTRRRAIDRLRARRAKGGGAIDVDPASVPGGARSPLDGASAAEARAKASAAVATLPAEERRVIELAYFEGLSQSEIAERTGSPLGTVKGRTRNALSRLRAVLPRSLGGEA